ncbi:RIP metalloprotease RseP [Anaerotalea alkaliphila]|uniref:Zinc metalloprotease n=1 Tax=Anaerotalea alkaliphila TaxID=2662126 RepID=A0A7X5KLQ6_9FIRM|nr:RIP metalloprotease RseP [Anaerotalea alkaliphila]NDL66164.1 RIP metalloprotease RseP [Anaerotalea alkaliphila]
MNIIVAILIFGFIVFFHELGHFLLARRNGILVEEFAVGMGPKLIGKKVGETLYSVRILPLGGFCKMLGEDESSDDQRAFSSKSPWAKIQTVLAGPAFNFILAFLFGMIYMALVGSNTNLVGEVLEGYPAESAGLQANDKILEVDGKGITSYREVSFYINQLGGAPVEMVVERAGEKLSLQMTPRFVEESGSYLVGLTYVPVDMNLLQVVKYGFLEMVFWIKMVYYSLGMMIGGNVSADQIAGPIGIVSVISQGYEESVKLGLKQVVVTISFYMVLLSANLGVMNLLPIPALDGGRLVFLLVEAVRGKPLDQEKEGMIHFIGFVLLMGLMLLILFNDIRKL